MLVGVISDTHDQIENVERAVALLNKKEVELVIHCGDFVSPFVWLPLSKLRCPIRGVFGNNDGDKFRHIQVVNKIEGQAELEERFLDFEVDERKIAVFHGDYAAIVDALISCGTYDAVFHGHTHQAVNKVIGNTLSLNPGAFLEKTTQEIKGASFAVYDTKTSSAEVIAL